ncbi:MAG: hypothetical protein DMD79_07830 [Candidatus Rokuibacteriota bacterium]|nr:MAG: hypothetical protein DMD79_07830 [Candidatus Rokubacteria bacterium]
MALPLGGLPHLGRVHRPGGGALGSAQRPDDARRPRLDLLGRDRLLHRARRLPDLHRAHHRRGGLQLPQDVRRGLHRLLATPARGGARRARACAPRRHRRHPEPPPPGAPEARLSVDLLLTRQLSKFFGSTRAVDHVDFRVAEGEVLALIGSNGAGKTTLVNLISGLIRPDSGAVVFQGRDITHASIHEKIAAGVARSFQLVNLFDKLTTLDNLALTVFSREGRTRRLLTLADRDLAVRDEAVSILDQFGLGAKAGVLAGGLAQGERKLLDVAVAYALRPKLLFLDEPTSGVSTREKAPIMDIITSVVQSGRITAVIIEHDMDVVFRYCPRIVAMHQGTILADGTPDEIRQNEQVTANLLGTPTGT